MYYPSTLRPIPILHLCNVSCFKRKYSSKLVSVYDFLERQDQKIFRKVSNSIGPRLSSIITRVKPSSYHLRKETCYKRKINTMRFKSARLLTI